MLEAAGTRLQAGMCLSSVTPCGCFALDESILYRNEEGELALLHLENENYGPWSLIQKKIYCE